MLAPFACGADGGRVQISLCSYSCSANMLGAQGLRISRVVTIQDFSIAKIEIKYPLRKQKVKSKLHPNHKRCKSEYRPATLSVLECRHSNTRIVPMFRKKSRHTIKPPPNRLIRNCPNKRFGGGRFYDTRRTVTAKVAQVQSCGCGGA